MTTKIRKINESPEEKKFSDLVDYCSFIVSRHSGCGDYNAQRKEEISEYKSKEFSIWQRLYDLQIPGMKPNFPTPNNNAGAYLPHFRLSLEVWKNGKTVLKINGKWAHAVFDIKKEKYVPGKWEDAIRSHVYECVHCNSEFPNTEPTAYQKKIENLAERCIKFTDRNGKQSDSGTNPYSAHLAMKFNSPNLTICYKATASPYSNGHCEVVVHENKKLVFKANGNYLNGPYHMIASKYIPGPWEKKIRKSSIR